jgi:hypothetical protein
MRQIDQVCVLECKPVLRNGSEGEYSWMDGRFFQCHCVARSRLKFLTAGHYIIDAWPSTGHTMTVSLHQQGPTPHVVRTEKEIFCKGNEFELLCRHSKTCCCVRQDMQQDKRCNFDRLELISSIGGHALAPESGLARRATRPIAVPIGKEHNAVQRRFWCQPSGKVVWTAHCRVAPLAQGPPCASRRALHCIRPDHLRVPSY